MTSATSFLLAFAGLVAINAIVAGLIWAQQKTTFYRSNFLVWVFGMVSFAAQGLIQSERWMSTAFGVSVFVFNLMLCDLVRRVLELRAPWRLHVVVFTACLVLSQILASVGAPFWMHALPIAVGTALPFIDLLLRAMRSSRRVSSVMARCALFAIAFFVLYQLAYPFGRLAPHLAQVGFVPPFLATAALSISTLSILLERTADDNSRLYQAAQLALASRDEFLMVASHELRIPLASLRRTMQGLRSGAITASPEQFSDLVQLAERQTDKMARLVDAMLRREESS